MTDDACEPQGPVGETSFAKTAKLVNDLVNRLREAGLPPKCKFDDSLQIAVIGQQSAGKSSLVEAISGIRLLKDKGTCTRCPIEVRIHSIHKGEHFDGFSKQPTFKMSLLYAVVAVYIYGADFELTFIDLPGLTASDVLSSCMADLSRIGNWRAARLKRLRSYKICTRRATVVCFWSQFPQIAPPFSIPYD